MLRRLLFIAFFMIAALPGGADAPVRPRGEAAIDSRFTIHVTPEMRRHTNILYALYFIGTAYSIAVLYAILRTRLAHKLRDLARRVVKWKPATTFVTFAFLSIAIGVFEFPLTFYSGYIVP